MLHRVVSIFYRTLVLNYMMLHSESVILFSNDTSVFKAMSTANKSLKLLSLLLKVLI